MKTIKKRYRSDDGAIATEMAVVIAILVAIALAVGGVLITKATTIANNVPDAPVVVTPGP